MKIHTLIYMKTRNGIVYDLKNSPYTIEKHNVTFYFSSQLHLDKFINRYESNRNKINESLSNRFNFYIYFNVLADFLLYRQVETRGFLIKDKDGVELCQEKLILIGEKMMRKS